MLSTKSLTLMLCLSQIRKSHQLADFTIKRFFGSIFQSMKTNTILFGNKHLLKYFDILLIFICLHVLISPHGWSQDVNCTISGIVVDDQNKNPIPNVDIIGDNFGTTSNSEGSFKLKLSKLPALITFSHVGYEIVQIKITDAKESIEIALKPETIRLDEIIVSSKQTQLLTDPDSLYIIDYEIYDKYIIAYGLVNKNPRNERIWLFNLEGKILSLREVDKVGRQIRSVGEETSKPYYLFMDCFGEVHLLTKNKIWQLFIKGNQIWLIYPTDFSMFFRFLFPVKAFIQGKYIFDYPNLSHQGDQSLIPAQKRNNRKLLYWKLSEPKIKRSLNPPVFNCNDSLLLFDFSANYIEYYSPFGKVLKRVPIRFHLQTFYDLLLFKDIGIKRDFTQKVLRDPINNEYFALFQKSGKYSLHQIDIHTGDITKKINLPELPFVEKIKIYNGVVYFLYNQRQYPYYKSLYRFIPKKNKTF